MKNLDLKNLDLKNLKSVSEIKFQPGDLCADPYKSSAIQGTGDKLFVYPKIDGSHIDCSKGKEYDVGSKFCIEQYMDNCGINKMLIYLYR